jgi:glycosyltransferase involved in cell wall biosynthesis
VKIAYITAGAAGMYCGSCMHDNTLAKALIRQGCDVALVPIYTPIRTDEQDVSIDRVFYGAINVYLEQKSALFRHTPWLVDRLLGGKRILEWASRRGSSSVDAKDLGALTLSMLQGEEGRQSKELERLVAWLRDDFRPDIVQLSNSMLLGMARRIREELSVPVLCSVQGEDIFLEDLEEPYKSDVARTLRERAADASGFIAPSGYYVDVMKSFLDVPAERMHLVPLGLDLGGFGGRTEEPAPQPFRIGYLARICPEKGLHLIVDAFRRLADEVGRDRVRLDVAGYLGERDRTYHDSIVDQVAAWGLDSVVRFHGEVDREQKIAFLDSLHVLSVPTVYREPKGLFVLEAMASGVPVVQPRHGAFPEVIEATGGGLLVEPESASDLAGTLGRLMGDAELRAKLGHAGREAVLGAYNDDAMAANTRAVYERYLGDGR